MNDSLNTAKWMINRVFGGRILLVDNEWHGSSKKHMFYCVKHEINFNYKYDAAHGKYYGGCPMCRDESPSALSGLKINKLQKFFFRFEWQALNQHGDKFLYTPVRFDPNLVVGVTCEKHKEHFEILAASHLSQKNGGCPKCHAENINSPIDNLKTCSGCGKRKSLDHFRSAGKLKKDGSERYSSRCKKCLSRRDDEYRAKMTEEDKQRYREAHDRYKKTHKYTIAVKRSTRLRKQKAFESGISRRVWIFSCEDCGSGVTRKAKPKHHKCDYCNRVSKKPTSNCKRCNKEFKAHKYSYAYCSDKCRQESKKEAKRIYKSYSGRDYRRRAKRFGVFYDPSVKRLKVFQRDKWRCCDCGCKVQKKDIYADNAAELDHIVPMSKGGPHSWSNVQTLCRRCNMDKSDKYEGQLVMGI